MFDKENKRILVDIPLWVFLRMHLRMPQSELRNDVRLGAWFWITAIDRMNKSLPLIVN